ncbi:hypothetical protein BDP27DRAFT_1358335 [Rhodocollybia butyracea]|uniref:F-box domain-containing protein n=1 Tax=Rhodocollybia butyracea TaxID=206335 RepID=A0A9P5UD00_9AGAR|nr:hypothetical protein BDP27DRAFT_1358335 [Rhodocollybia butyracea]
MATVGIKQTLSLDSSLAPVTQTATLLTKLPIELLLEIAKELKGDFLDLLCFGMTCVKIWEVTENIRFQYLRFILQKRIWAGSRIICLGEYARDLPQGLLSEEDMEKLKEKLKEKPRIQNRRRRVAELGDVTEDDSEIEDEMKKEDIADVTLLRLVTSDSSRLRTWELVDAGPVARAWLSLDLSTFTLRRAPSTSPSDCWMLRNLTKKEFVIKSQGGTTDGLLQVLLSLISWSNDSSLSTRFDETDAEKLIRGPWAGDRIEATLHSLHEHGENPDWKNITDEVLKFVERLAEKDLDEDSFLDTPPF